MPPTEFGRRHFDEQGCELEPLAAEAVAVPAGDVRGDFTRPANEPVHALLFALEPFALRLTGHVVILFSKNYDAAGDGLGGDGQADERDVLGAEGFHRVRVGAARRQLADADLDPLLLECAHLAVEFGGNPQLVLQHELSPLFYVHSPVSGPKIGH